MAMFVTGNLNLFDAKAARDYGYDSVKDYQEDFLEQWYEDVKEATDHVYILGNVSRFAPEAALKFLRSLPGTKQLVIGPRDQISPDTKRGWELSREYYDTFQYTNTAIRRRMHGGDAILSHYGPEADCWWAPRQTRASFVTAWQDITNEGDDEPWVTPTELSVSWNTWGRLINWDEVKEMFADRPLGPQDMID